MPSVVEHALASDQSAQPAGAPAAQNAQEVISTPAAASLMGLSEATLRNYAWLNSLSADERASRKLQAPPAGLPIPSRRGGRLFWPRAEVMQFAEQKSKQAE
jgi:predicted DNA-binding transcriptional regulator AlpA